jgi:hypothetical protein
MNAVATALEVLSMWLLLAFVPALCFVVAIFYFMPRSAWRTRIA